MRNKLTPGQARWTILKGCVWEGEDALQLPAEDSLYQKKKEKLNKTLTWKLM
jgi:hypothetical protein